MPLRAVIDGVQVQAFDLNSDEWRRLKSNYKSHCLTMNCCGHKAIPKNSKLGTQYFAHSRRGDCSSSPETADHLKLKTIIAQAASQAGWKVITELKGSTPSGEAWIADVYCQKNQSQIVFEIQWSHQSYREYERRTKKYTESGINRCAWFYRGYKNRDNQIPESKEMPCFAISVEDGNYKIKKFDVDVQTFVDGMFNRKLKWQPVKGQILKGFAYYNESNCLKCGSVNNYFCSIGIYSMGDKYLGGGLYYTYGGESVVQELIKFNIPQQTLRKHLIGSLDHIYNKKGDYAYMAHGCLHCNGVNCNHTYRYDYHSDKSQSIEFSFPYDPELLYLKPEWHFTK